MATLDWKALQEAAGEIGGTEPVPNDEYEVEVFQATAKESSTGKPMIDTRFRIETGPYAGRILYNNFTLSVDNPNALRIWFSHMAAMGLNQAFFAQNPTTEQVAEAMVDRRCVVQTNIREFNGQKRNDVVRVLPARTPGPAAHTTILPPDVPF